MSSDTTCAGCWDIHTSYGYSYHTIRHVSRRKASGSNSGTTVWASVILIMVRTNDTYTSDFISFSSSRKKIHLQHHPSGGTNRSDMLFLPLPPHTHHAAMVIPTIDDGVYGG